MVIEKIGKALSGSRPKLLACQLTGDKDNPSQGMCGFVTDGGTQFMSTVQVDQKGRAQFEVKPMNGEPISQEDADYGRAVIKKWFLGNR